jgi:alpha-galactosidase
MRWRAGSVDARATIRPDVGGLLIRCELINDRPESVRFNAWRPIEARRQAIARPQWTAALINGYQSWDYAGVHALDPSPASGVAASTPAPTSWWTAAFYAPESNLMFVAQALSAERLSTVFHWDGHMLRCEQGGSPLSQPEQRTGPSESLELGIGPGSVLESEQVFLLCGRGTETLREAAWRAGSRSRALHYPVVPRGWCSWYHIGLAVTAADIERHARFIATQMPGLQSTLSNGHRPLVQLDDGWMPRWQMWGDWVANEFFPDGMPAVARAVRDQGAEAGIWLAPFHVAKESRMAADHQDWLLRRTDGELLVDPRLTHRAYHLLDATNPAVLDFFGELFGSLNRGGFTYFKLDFLYGGAYEAVRHDRSKTGTEAMRQGLARIFETVNPRGRKRDSFILACGAPLMPVVGLAHGFRIGGDVGAPQMTEDLKPGPPYVGFALVLAVARNLAARLFFGRALFTVDPDVVMAASPQLSEDEARVLITLCALSGGIFLYSDDLETLPPERLGLLQNPNVLGLVGGAAAEPLHLFDRPDPQSSDHWMTIPDDLPAIWIRPETGGTFTVAIYNWSSEPRSQRLEFAELGAGMGDFRLLDLWSPEPGGQVLGVHRSELNLELSPHSVRLLRMEPA